MGKAPIYHCVYSLKTLNQATRLTTNARQAKEDFERLNAACPCQYGMANGIATGANNGRMEWHIVANHNGQRVVINVLPQIQEEK